MSPGARRRRNAKRRKPAVWFTTEHDHGFSWSATFVSPLNFDNLAAAMAAVERPRDPEPDLVSPELYARLQARLAPHVGERNTAETRMSIGTAIHAELEEYLRAGVTPYDHDDRVDALAYAIRSIPPRHAMSQNVPRVLRRSLFARVPRLRAELRDLLTTPDGFPFVA